MPELKRRGVSFGDKALPLSTQQIDNSKQLRAKPRKYSALPACLFWTCVVTVVVYLTANRPTQAAYHPSLLVDGEYYAVEDYPHPFIHVVHTRFMQEQANLTALGEARLALLETFCLPTLKAQTSQNFLWILKTDPELPRDLLHRLKEDLQGFPNFYLVASNRNFRINQNFPGAWRDGAQGADLSQSTIHTGNRTLLEMAMALQAKLPIVETRLDADDGLHRGFMEQLQKQASAVFSDMKDSKWMYWCARRHMEWHWMKQDPPNSTVADLTHAYGSLTGIQNSHLCITPGFSVGFPVGTPEPDVPVFPHHTLVERIRHLPPEKSCGLAKPDDCLQFVETHVFEAIRSRTPTSAGMLNVQLDDSMIVKTPWLMYAYWDMLFDSFGIAREHVKWINDYVYKHLAAIAHDNLAGQCTSGHSCKDEAKADLSKILDSHPKDESTNATGPPKRLYVEVGQA